MWNVKNTREKRVMKSIFDWKIYTPYSCDAETIFMDFVSMQTTCSTQSPSSMSHHVSSSNTLSSFLEFYEFFGCLMFNGSIFSLLCRVRECLCSSIYLCWRVRTSMRRSQKRRQTNYPKRGRERDRSCRPFPARAFICPCEVCLCCTFVFLCVCVCQSLLFSFLTISAHSRGHTGSWMAWATEDPSKLL